MDKRKKPTAGKSKKVTKTVKKKSANVKKADLKTDSLKKVKKTDVKKVQPKPKKKTQLKKTLLQKTKEQQDATLLYKNLENKNVKLHISYKAPEDLENFIKLAKCVDLKQVDNLLNKLGNHKYYLFCDNSNPKPPLYSQVYHIYKQLN